MRCDIAILGLNYPPEPTGIAPYTGALADALSQLDHRVAAIVSQPHYPEWTIRPGYRRWRTVEYLNGVYVRRRLHYVPRSPRGVRRLLSELTFGLRLVFARLGRPRQVIAVSPALFATAMVVLRLRFTPRRPQLVVWVQDIYTLGLKETGEGRKGVALLTRWVESRTLRAADRVVVIHPRFAGYVAAEFGVDPAKVIVIRNWTHLADTKPIEAHTAKSELGWPTDMVLAVHTGNMGIKQGLENIVEAARIADGRNEPVHFLLVGDGAERQQLIELAHGISRITFVEPLSDAQYGSALCAADVLLVNEKAGVSEMAVPSKLTSYFHAGRPIVAATDPEGTTAQEVLGAEAGVIVPAGEPNALLDAVLATSADREAAAAYGRNGKRYRDKVLDSRVAIEHWEKLLRQL